MADFKTKICCIGAGYVGGPTMATIALFCPDVKVHVVDINPKQIARWNSDKLPIYEPGLDVLVNGNMKVGRLAFTTDLANTVPNADAVFIAVGTPSRRGDGHADLSYVYAAAREIAPLLKGYTVVVTKSTVPVGTGDEVERILRDSGTPHRFAVVSNPEFLREGAAIGDFKRPDRIVIGAEDDFGQEVMRDA